MRATRRAPTLVVTEPCAAAARCSARSTWSSRCCTARGARTAPSRACSRWPACATSAPACSPPRSSMDKAFMKVVLAGRRAPGAAVDHRHPRGVGARPGGLPRAGRRRSASRCSSSRPAAARASASPRSTTPTELERGARGGRPARPQGAGRGSGRGGPRDRVRRAAVARRDRRRPACRRRSGSAATTSSTTSRPSTSPSEHTELDIPADLPADVTERMRDAGRARLRGASAARGWPGSTSS